MASIEFLRGGGQNNLGQLSQVHVWLGACIRAATLTNKLMHVTVDNNGNRMRECIILNYVWHARL